MDSTIATISINISVDVILLVNREQRLEIIKPINEPNYNNAESTQFIYFQHGRLIKPSIT